MDEVFSVCSKPISDENLSNIIKRVDEYSKSKPTLEQLKLDLSISEFIDYDTEIIDRRYFIKPLGHSAGHYPDNATPSNNVDVVSFSKKRPRSVRVGDVLICYAVGSQKLLGYFEVITQPAFSGNDDDRWPWSVQVKNLCPSYSEKWMIFNNTLARIKSEYAVDAPLTYIGSKTLGALSFGADRIQLDERFANYLISIIERDAKQEMS